jgi:hypothetical protein
MAIDPRDGPIPGENYTSDTRNYPWHRPPQFTNMNDAFEYIAEQIAEPDISLAIMTMLEMGASVSSVTDMLITGGVGGGKWTVDYGLLLAGPVSHMICLMARKDDVEVNLGVDEGKKRKPTKAFFDALERDPEANAEVGAEIAGALGLGGDSASSSEAPSGGAPTTAPSSGGLMGAKPAASAPPQTGLGGVPPAEPAAPMEGAPAPTEEEVM